MAANVLEAPETDRHAIAEKLSPLFADICTLLLKTKNLVWNQFGSRTRLHEAAGDTQAKDRIRPLLTYATEKVSDQAMLDLLTQRMQTHEKTAWELRSPFED